MKVLSGHLTTTEKRAIKQMLHLKLTSARTPKKLYYLKLEEGVYTVIIEQQDRGLIPVHGSELRASKYKATFKI